MIAFTWIDSYFSPNFYDDILVNGNKLATLEGYLS